MAGLPNPIDSGFVSGTAPLAFQYATQNVPPFNALPITKDTFIQFTVTSIFAIPIQLTWRILLPEGRIVQSQANVVSTVGRFTTSFTFPLTDGFLLSVHAVATAGAGRGQVAIGATILLGAANLGFVVTRLFNGYLTGFDTIGWPPGNFESTSAGAGNLRTIAGTLPAAGAEISESVAQFARWKIRYFTFTLTTSATVANRDVRLLIDDGVNPLALIDYNLAQAASITFRYTFVPGLGAVFSQNNTIAVPAGTDIMLQTFWRVRTSTINLQVGDQYSAPQYFAEDWIAI